MADGVEIVSDLEFVTPKEKLIPTEDKTKVVEPKGTILGDDFHIFMTEAMLREVVEYSKSDLGLELGGVFVGDFYSWRGKLYVEIAGYIRAQRYENTAASFKFTHDSWSAITRAKEKTFNDRLIVGWHHTHPGYGIFLSGYDQFIHRNFFNLSWMFALVVDPKRDTLGFFQWKNKRIEHCGFFFVR